MQHLLCYFLNMARPLRLEFPGAVYHITARGNGQNNVFIDNHDRIRFLDILTKTVARYNWVCHAFCLMDNHYHLLIETPDPSLSIGMRQLNGVYTQTFNRNHNRVGHVFQGRFKSILVEKDSHLLELCRYIVLNPVKAGMVKSPEQWKWSSYNSTAQKNKNKELLYTDWLLSQFSEDTSLARRLYRVFVNDRREFNPWQKLTGQIFLGSDIFCATIQELIGEKEKIKEIPSKQRYPGRPTLTALLAHIETKGQRNKAIITASLQYSYTLKEIGEYLGVHYATVSRIISKTRNKMSYCKT